MHCLEEQTESLSFTFYVPNPPGQAHILFVSARMHKGPLITRLSISRGIAGATVPTGRYPLDSQLKTVRYFLIMESKHRVTSEHI